MNTTTDSVRIVIFKNWKLVEFLVLTESNDPENWKLPGGKFDNAGETPEAAASRELAQEIGLNTMLVQLHKAGELLNDDGRSRRHIYAIILNAVNFTASSEILQVQWVTKTTIPAGANTHHIQSAVTLAHENLAR